MLNLWPIVDHASDNSYMFMSKNAMQYHKKPVEALRERLLFLWARVQHICETSKIEGLKGIRVADLKFV